MPNAQNQYFSEAGLLLFDNAQIATDLTTIISSEAAHPEGPGLYPHIGSGKFARVSEVPDYPDLCVKMSSPATSLRAWRYGDGQGRAEDLVVQARVMDALHGLLLPQAVTTGVYAPQQYVACKMPGGVHVAIQERLPKSYESIDKLLVGRRATGNMREMHSTLLDRIRGAVGHSLLRFTMNDIGDPSGLAIGNNILVESYGESLSDVDDVNIAVIDQPNRQFRMARLWLGLSRVTG